jgi:hypothetical protein
MKARMQNTEEIIIVPREGVQLLIWKHWLLQPNENSVL